MITTRAGGVPAKHAAQAMLCIGAPASSVIVPAPGVGIPARHLDRAVATAAAHRGNIASLGPHEAARNLGMAALNAGTQMRRSRFLMITFGLMASAMLWAGNTSMAIGADVNSLSNADASAGLKKALDQGINQAVGKLGVPGGFLNNPAVKIPLPPKLAKAEGAMRMVGMGSQADELVTAMNRAAEAAVPESKVLLKQALHQMSLSDAKQILTGGDDSATQYFKRATYAPLEAKFAPIVDAATQKVKLAQNYDAVAHKAVELGVLKPGDATIESYVTQKTLDGLFTMMAEEERAIRKDPMGQASDLLKKVFGAVH